ncbi:type VII secretion integral membrane protein EccD [Streptomyces sp. TLI_171]|uniref:type VII secretion integral membrane protein EccD n=1 Tax=Streptomyces sp. TLI_171 TaxID=1938859 RepID=UPI000C19617A|nr:type VII secretion integral membrane protein EccD [Streptomyces sp. TLI_171]RKE22040.1 type VII secretion integral membrane protein EccD [Streptomyces sp. TLI_171]
MNEAIAGLCRLHLKMPDRSEDLAVPDDVPVGDLLPAVLEFAGISPEPVTAPGSGWVLQCLGGAPLDDETTLASVGLRDGETVLLRPHHNALPPLVSTPRTAEAAAASPATATAVVRARLLRAAAVVAAAAVWAVAAYGGQPATVACLALLLLTAAPVVAWALHDEATGAVLGLAGTAGAALAGWLLADSGLTGHAAAQTVLAAPMLAAGAGASAAAVTVVAWSSRFRPAAAGVGVVAAFALLAGGTALLLGPSPEHSAAVTAVLAVALTGSVPVLAFRVAGLQLRPLPTSPSQLQDGIEPFPSADVARRSAVASSWLTALFTATGAVCAVCAVTLALEGTTDAVTTATVLSLLLLLHGRHQGSVRQRLPVQAAGTAGAAAILLGRAAAGALSLPGLVGCLLGATAALALAVGMLPGRRLVPYWGRAAELAHSLAACALLPLALWVLGLYGHLRALTS